MILVVVFFLAQSIFAVTVDVGEVRHGTHEHLSHPDACERGACKRSDEGAEPRQPAVEGREGEGGTVRAHKPTDGLARKRARRRRRRRCWWLPFHLPPSSRCASA